MSIWAVNWALHTQIENSTTKLVLIALANFADDEDEAWPKVSTLAELASVSERTVLRALSELEDQGLLNRLGGRAVGGRGGLVKTNSVYRLAVPDEVSRRTRKANRRPMSLVSVDNSANDSPSEDQYDTSVTSIVSDGKTPSEDQYDTSVTSINQSDMGVTNQYDTSVTLTTNKEEPSKINHHPSPLPPGAEAGEGDGSDGRMDENSNADWELIRCCLPENMRALDIWGLAQVSNLLRDLVAGGWPRHMIRSVLAGQELPAQVRNLSGLVVHRLKKIPVNAPPVSPAAENSEPSEPHVPVVPAWMAARRKAIDEGLPEANYSSLWWMKKFSKQDQESEVK